MNDPNRYRRSFRHRYDHLKSAVEAESACWRSPLRGAEASTADFRVERETSALGHRRRWRAAGVSLVLLTVFGVLGRAADSDPLLNPAHRLAPAAPAWSDLIDAFAHNPDIAADFTERRFFSFKKEPVDLKGEVRVSVTRGLSLHYTAPEERTVILDAHGVLIRAAAGITGRPPTPGLRPRMMPCCTSFVLISGFLKKTSSFTGSAMVRRGPSPWCRERSRSAGRSAGSRSPARPRRFARSNCVARRGSASRFPSILRVRRRSSPRRN